MSTLESGPDGRAGDSAPTGVGGQEERTKEDPAASQAAEEGKGPGAKESGQPEQQEKTQEEAAEAEQEQQQEEEEDEQEEEVDPESLFSYLLEDEIMTFSQTSEGNLRCARIFMKESTRELRQVLDPGPPGWEEASLGGAAGAADGGGSGGEDGGEDLDGQGDGGQYSGGGNYDEEEPGSPTSAEDKVRARNLATSNLTEVVSARMLEAELDARKAAVVKKLERAFDIIDADKSGDLDWGEIQDALDPDGEQGAELHEIFGSHDILAPLSALSMWEKLFALIDVNGDGTVDFDELTGYVFGLIEKKFRQIPRSGTHYLMDRIMRRGLGATSHRD